MRKSLIIILILTVFLEGIGGFLHSQTFSRHALKLSNTTSASVSTDLNSNDKEKPGDNNTESHEILEMPSEDDYFHCPTFELKAALPEDQGQETYSDFYIRHYPWTSKEIHTPPPKA